MLISQQIGRYETMFIYALRSVRSPILISFLKRKNLVIGQTFARSLAQVIIHSRIMITNAKVVMFILDQF